MATSRYSPPPGGEGKTRSMDHLSDFRMVLVGKTGAGKSASGNTILGRQDFEVLCSAQSVTRQCERSTEETVTVIDTPGLFDTQMTESSVRTQLVQCITLSSPGPHVFLLVVAVGRFTKEEQKAVARFQDVFGEAALKEHTVVLFTHGDQLKKTSIEKFIQKSSELQKLVEECGDRYHVFNNKDTDERKREQVNELLEKITAMVEKNGGQCYTNDMYQEVESAIERRKEELRLLYEQELREKERTQEVLEEVTQSFKQERSKNKSLESKMGSMMKEMRLKDTDRIEKQKKIDDLMKQTREDQELLNRKWREEAEMDFEKSTIIENLVAHVHLTTKSSSCRTQ